MSKKKKIIELYGFSIETDSIYEIQEKKDSSAPDGFQEHNTTKDLSFDLEDSVSGAVFNIERGIWDTGLDDSSKYLRKAIPAEEERKKALESLHEHIVKPFELIKGTNRLDFKDTSENNEFWGDYRIKLKRGGTFNTNNIEELLNLYLCLVFKRLTPIELESHPSFKQPISSYVIVNKESAISRAAQTELDKMEAISGFMGLLKTDLDGLLAILGSLNINITKNSDKPTFIRIFNNWLSDKTDKYQNTQIFLKAYENYKTPKGKAFLILQKDLKDLFVKNNSPVTMVNKEVFWDGISLGNSFSAAAEKILSDKELTKLYKIEIAK